MAKDGSRFAVAGLEGQEVGGEYRRAVAEPFGGTQAWLNAWEYMIPFLAFPDDVRRVIYTTNAIEALNRQLRKAIKTKGSFPTEDAARKARLPSAAERRPAMDTNPELDNSAARVQDPLR
jgi:transposase-like protein